MCSLALCSLYIWGEGIRRLVLHFTATAGVIEDVDGEVMSIIAAIGVAVNIALAFVLGVEVSVVYVMVHIICYSVHKCISCFISNHHKLSFLPF